MVRFFARHFHGSGEKRYRRIGFGRPFTVTLVSMAKARFSCLSAVLLTVSP